MIDGDVKFISSTESPKVEAPEKKEKKRSFTRTSPAAASKKRVKFDDSSSTSTAAAPSVESWEHLDLKRRVADLEAKLDSKKKKYKEKIAACKEKISKLKAEKMELLQQLSSEKEAHSKLKGILKGRSQKLSLE